MKKFFMGYIVCRIHLRSKYCTYESPFHFFKRSLRRLLKPRCFENEQSEKSLADPDNPSITLDIFVLRLRFTQLGMLER